MAHDYADDQLFINTGYTLEGLNQEIDNVNSLISNIDSLTTDAQLVAIDSLTSYSNSYSANNTMSKQWNYQTEKAITIPTSFAS